MRLVGDTASSGTPEARSVTCTMSAPRSGATTTSKASPVRVIVTSAPEGSRGDAGGAEVAHDEHGARIRICRGVDPGRRTGDPEFVERRPGEGARGGLEGRD